jgi:predicted TIM-barrel fold metal-dependent hydrolase
VIDCDLHPQYNDIKDLIPYMDPAYRYFMEGAGFGGFDLPTIPWLHQHGFYRNETVPDGNRLPGSDPALMIEQALDSRGGLVEYAILNPEVISFVSSLPNPRLASMLATAYNRWLDETFLAADERFKASVVVATQDPALACEEIRRYADHPGFVSVMLGGGATAGYGHPKYHPIYETAQDVGMCISSHPSNEGCGIFPPMTACGHPTYYLEYHTLWPLTAMTHLVSLVAHGVFEKFPDLNFGILESGFLWLPGLLWRLDGDWKALRSEVPWVKNLPSETVAERVFLGIQPIPEPPNGRQLLEHFQLFPAFEHMLLYATDYPHWDGDEPELGLRRVPAAWRDAVASENARRFYKLPPKKHEAASGAVETVA